MRRRWLSILAVLWGCPTSGSKPPSALPQVGGFTHDVHLAEGLECDACHVADPKAQFALLRPGSNGHAPCDGCHVHEQRFYEPPGEFCKTCHVSVDPLKRGSSPLHPYPQVQNTAQLVASFNHKQHVAAATREASGSGLACTDCHQVASPESAYASFPKHDACSKCHAEVVAPRMNDCAGCHQEDGPGRKRRFLHHLENDVRFTHGKHQVAPTGEKVECQFCHEEVASSVHTADLNLPEMRVCTACHDSELTPVEKRMNNCGLCHTGDVNSKPLPGNHTASVDVEPSSSQVLGANPLSRRRVRNRCGDHPGDVRKDTRRGRPAFSFLELPSLLQLAASATVATSTPAAQPPPPAFPETTGTFSRPKPPAKKRGAAPQDHTPVFRKRHEKAAQAAGAACNYCHLGISGSTRDACQDCHAVSRPRDHNLRFRTTGHGRVSARDPQACATCHEIDYCTECHSLAPQSHFPLQTFRERHSRAARVNARSCMTCHTFESTCERCHSLDLTIEPRNVGELGR